MSRSTIDSASTTQDVLTVINPATEEVLDEVPCFTWDRFRSAVEQARRALDLWQRDEAQRRDALRRCAEVLRKRTNLFELATQITREQGKTKREALNEVHAASHWFTSLAEMEFPRESRQTESGIAEVHYEPLGIVGAITAWNYPVFLAACKIASALIPGNVMLLKPSPFTPLATLQLVELLTRMGPGDDRPLPKGVVTVLPGASEMGKWLVESDQVEHVSFTGSVKVGKRIWENSSDTLRSLTLELGGNDAAIVLADADLEQIIEPLFWGAFTNAGQFCTGIKRLYVQEPIYEQVVDRLTRLACGTTVGDGLHPKTRMGPLTHREQYRRIIELVERAKQSGATIRAGGDPLVSPGWFYPPTIITDVTDSDPIVAEEQFGPVLPILSFRDVDEAIHRANATNFGLGGSIWTRDEPLAADVARRLQCGTVWINQHGTLDPQTPFGGHKHSGVGYENGWAGVSAFTKIKVVHKSASPRSS